MSLQFVRALFKHRKVEGRFVAVLFQLFQRDRTCFSVENHSIWSDREPVLERTLPGGGCIVGDVGCPGGDGVA